MTNCFGSILILCVKVQAYDYTTGSFQRNHYYIIIYYMNYIVIKFKKFPYCWVIVGLYKSRWWLKHKLKYI